MIEDLLNFYESENQCVISYELICLFRWLVKNDSNKLKKIISKALSSGLKEDLTRGSLSSGDHSLEDIQEDILEFFTMMEAILIESLSDHAIKKAVEKKLMPSIDKIDSNVCDDATVRFSVEKATSKIEKNPQENPKDLLLEELLKRWKPNKKNVLN